jgi:hypothetical protein
MSANPATKPRIFIDADVLFAGMASPNAHSASLVILRMAEITLIEALASEQVIIEVERNLCDKMPHALPAYQLLVNRCLRVVADPSPEEVHVAEGVADAKDLPILLAARREDCQFLTTFNVRHFEPGMPGITVLKPGDLVLRIRYLLSQLHN